MIRRADRLLALLMCLAALCGSLRAQNEKTITVTLRMLDSRTGKLIATSDFLVRVNHESTVHGNWVVKNDDGTGKLTAPSTATELSIRATYESSTLIYRNCDANKDRGSAERAPSLDRWYPVSEILEKGIVAPNGCVGKKIPDRLQVLAKPGEFVFFVRKPNALEQFEQ